MQARIDEIDSAFINKLCHVTNQIRKYVGKYPHGVKPLAYERIDRSLQKADERNYRSNMSKLRLMLESIYGTKLHVGICHVLFVYWAVNTEHVEDNWDWHAHKRVITDPVWWNGYWQTFPTLTDEEIFEFGVDFENLINSNFDRREMFFMRFKLRHL